MGKGNSRRRREREKLTKNIAESVLARATLTSSEIKMLGEDLKNSGLRTCIEDFIEGRVGEDAYDVSLRIHNFSRQNAIMIFYRLKLSLVGGILKLNRWDERFELADIILPEEYVFK